MAPYYFGLGQDSDVEEGTQLPNTHKEAEENPQQLEENRRNEKEHDWMALIPYCEQVWGVGGGEQVPVRGGKPPAAPAITPTPTPTTNNDGE